MLLVVLFASVVSIILKKDSKFTLKEDARMEGLPETFERNGITYKKIESHDRLLEIQLEIFQKSLKNEEELPSEGVAPGRLNSFANH